jgi:hypothetical protein
MSIWDDLYSDLVKSELKSENSLVEGEFLTVESKVEALRRRVGLDTVNLSKKASLEKTASSGFRLVIAQDEFVPAKPTQEEEDALLAMKGYLMQLIDQKRASIDVAVAISDLHSKFSDFSELINSNKRYLEEFFEKYQEKYLRAPSIPTPTPNTIKLDEKEDNATFENIADKLKM